MRIIFIRHAEPDYEHKTLTEKGFREAEILKDRVLKWNVDEFYTSPLERSQYTIAPALKAMGRTTVTLDFLKEFVYFVEDPTTGQIKVPWDFMPQFWTREPLLYDHNDFYKHPILQANPDYEKAVKAMRSGLDELLEGYGYTRDNNCYKASEMTENDDDRTIVITAHLGANLEAIGYLLDISPLVLQQTVYLAPTSVCILNAEKRSEGYAMFRAQVIGDVSHLTAAHEPISEYGAFSRITGL